MKCTFVNIGIYFALHKITSMLVLTLGWGKRKWDLGRQLNEEMITGALGSMQINTTWYVRKHFSGLSSPFDSYLTERERHLLLQTIYCPFGNLLYMRKGDNNKCCGWNSQEGAVCSYSDLRCAKRLNKPLLLLFISWWADTQSDAWRGVIFGFIKLEILLVILRPSVLLVLILHPLHMYLWE